MRELAPGSRREPRVSLVFYFREGAKIVVPGPDPLVVGRTWPADIVVDDPSVSRTHARFFDAPDGGVVFEDMGSTNGTRLNGMPVPRGRIAPGDEVRVGDVSVALHVLSTEAGVHGLLGYDTFLRLLEDELVRARTFARPVTLLMVGARAPGHSLRTWAPKLLETLRPVDRAAVYAADAVLVALPEAARTEADALGTAIASGDAALRYGLATFPHDGTTADELLDAAPTAMVRGPGVAPPPPSGSSGVVVSAKMRVVWDMIDRVAPSILPVAALRDEHDRRCAEPLRRQRHRRGARPEDPGANAHAQDAGARHQEARRFRLTSSMRVSSRSSRNGLPMLGHALRAMNSVARVVNAPPVIRMKRSAMPMACIRS